MQKITSELVKTETNRKLYVRGLSNSTQIVNIMIYEVISPILNICKSKSS